MAAAQVFRGTVKQVLSGDTVVVRARAAPGVNNAPERTISLSHVSAPRVGRKDEKEEPFAWASREYLRRALVGREVAFRIDYTTNGGREYGSVLLNDENVAIAALRAGWVKLREGKSGDAPEGFAAATAQAEAEGAGMFSLVNSGVKPLWNVQHTAPDDLRAFVDKHKGQAVDAVVERVRDGTTMQLLLMTTPPQMVTLMLSGARSPTYRKDMPDQPDLIEPFAAEARSFTEVRLLQRSVKVHLESISQRSVVGSVIHPAGNISELLLREGLARLAEWSLSLATSGPKPLRDAERDARQRRLRIWKDVPVPAAPTAAATGAGAAAPSATGLEARGSSRVVRILRIHNGESVQVQLPNNTDARVFLAWIRQPRAKEPREEPWQAEAKEFLRSKLVGQRVTAITEYVRPAEGEFDARICVTLRLGDVDIGEALVSKGLAAVTRRRGAGDVAIEAAVSGDERAAAAYDALLVAEDRAQKGKRGMYGDRAPDTAAHVTDASESVAKARQLLPLLKRGGRLHGIVEHVFSGSRFRVLVPREGCRLVLVLAGVRVPRPDADSAAAAEALSIANNRVLQRDIDFDIDAVDRTGAFIGTVYIRGSGSADHSLAVVLLEAGSAAFFSTGTPSTDNALFAAESRAKSARKGMWVNYDAEAEKAREDAQRAIAEASAAAPAANARRTRVLVAGLGQGNTFYGQPVDSGAALETLMNDFARFHLDATAASAQPGWTARKGDICSARFSADKAWYRARITGTTGDHVTVSYIDYGNSESIPRSALRPLPQAFSSLAPQALEFRLAGVSFPTDNIDDDDSYAFAARNWLEDAIVDRRIIADVVAEVDKVSSAIVFDEEDDAAAAGASPAAANARRSVNAAIIEAGLAIVEKPPRGRNPAPWLARLADAQEAAKAARANMWQYGDPTADEDESRRRW